MRLSSDVARTGNSPRRSDISAIEGEADPQWTWPEGPPLTHVYHRLAFHVAMAKTKFRRISDDPHSHDHRTPSGRRLGQTVGSLDQHRLGRGGGGALAAPLVLDRALAQHGPCARPPLVGHRAGRARDCSAGPPSFDCLLYGLDRAAP